MIGVLKKIWDFAGEEQDNIRKSMILGFFYAVFHMFQIAAIYVVVLALVGGSTDSAPAWQALGLLLASILGRAVLNRFSQLQQTHAGYFMVANKRIFPNQGLNRHGADVQWRRLFLIRGSPFLLLRQSGLWFLLRNPTVTVRCRSMW